MLYRDGLGMGLFDIFFVFREFRGLVKCLSIFMKFYTLVFEYDVFFSFRFYCVLGFVFRVLWLFLFLR